MRNDPAALTVPIVKPFDDPGVAIGEVATGLCHAGIVRQYMDPAAADAQAEIVVRAQDPRKSDDPEKEDVPGGTLGPSLFEHADDPDEYFRQAQVVGARMASLFGDTHPAELLSAISSFESLGQRRGRDYRIRPVVHNGMPAAYNRGLIFPAGGETIVPIHEDVANVRALKPHRFEIADTEIVLAHNLYLRNRRGEGSLYMFTESFSDDEKREIDEAQRLKGTKSDIATTGYPYPEHVFSRQPLRLDVETGDYVVFRADYPHKVANHTQPGSGFRVSWNGFMTILKVERSNALKLAYWT